MEKTLSLRNSFDPTPTRPFCVWFTGLSGAGKSTLANSLHDNLRTAESVFVIDGDMMRQGVSRDLGYGVADREENVRRAAELAKLLFLNDMSVIVSLMSPFRRGRDYARSLFPEGSFYEIHLNTPLSVCEKRDPKGIYAKARRGEVSNVTGADCPFEAPIRPELTLNTAIMNVDDCLADIMSLFQREENRKRA